jgi:hypothetical protein
MLLLELIKEYLLEVAVVGALVEILKHQWFIKFLHKNIRWWANRLAPVIMSLIICYVWELENFCLDEYLKDVLICVAFSGLVYTFLKKLLKRNSHEEENNNY